MIVIDASALVDWLLVAPGRGAAVGAEMRAASSVHTMDFAQLEVAAALRGLVMRRSTTVNRAELALGRLAATPLALHGATPLVRRTWALRDTHTPYDAAYVALAEALDAPLLTTDRRLARSRGHRARIIEAA